MAKGKGKDKGKKGERAKKGGSRGSKSEFKSLEKEAEADRAKAAATLWEARLEVTEVSRREYRDAARRLARNNEELEWQQRKLEKDSVEVITYLKKQDLEKEELLEKMKQQLNDFQQQAKEEREKVADGFTKQLEEMEEKFQKKAKEIGLIQIELKMIQEFRKEKSRMEKELEDLKENLAITKKEHQETICTLERKFIEEKQRLEREAEKKIIMLAERAHHEALMKLDNAGRAVFAENIRLHEAFSYHMKETEELQKSKQKLEENNAFLLLEKQYQKGLLMQLSKQLCKETNEMLIQEKILQSTQHKSQIQELQNKVNKLEAALCQMAREFRAEIKKTEHKALVKNQAIHTEIEKLQQLLEMKEREMSRVKKLARNILDQRTEVEMFFLDALEQVKQEIMTSRKCYKQVAQDAYQKKMMAAFAGKEEYPKIRTFNDNIHSTNSVQKDLQEAEKWTNIQKGKVDISELTWEQKESVLRLLFAKMNGLRTRLGDVCEGRKAEFNFVKKHSHALIPLASFTTTESKPRPVDPIPDSTFLTQQAEISELTTHKKTLPDIHIISPQRK